MKRVKRGLVDSRKLISKSAYAKECKITPAAVGKKIDRGYLVVVPFEGGEVIYKDW